MPKVNFDFCAFNEDMNSAHVCSEHVGVKLIIYSVVNYW